MNINFKFLLIGTSLSLIPNLLYAQCVPAQNCAELGYKENANKGGCLKCPFGDGWYCPCDTSYKYTCTGSNEKAGTEKCGNKYKSCTCSDGFEWKDDKCQKREETAVLGECTGYAKNCKIADILNSDGTCTTDKVNGKIPIGVVVYIGSDNCGQALALETFRNKQWSIEYVDIPNLPNYGSVSAAQKDIDSCGNTQTIIKYGNEGKYPAAWVAVNYMPSSVSETKGKWCLPAAGIAQSMMDNYSAINSSLSKVGGETLLYYDINWSSTENYSNSVWAWSYNSNYLANYSKTYSSFNVRPVLKF